MNYSDDFQWNNYIFKLRANIFSFTQTDPNADIEVLDIPVNAVATALKDFFSKHLPPLFDKDLMTELEDIAGKISESIYIISIRNQ